MTNGRAETVEQLEYYDAWGGPMNLPTRQWLGNCFDAPFAYTQAVASDFGDAMVVPANGLRPEASFDSSPAIDMRRPSSK